MLDKHRLRHGYDGLRQCDQRRGQMSKVTTRVDRRFREWILEGNDNDLLVVDLWAHGGATVTTSAWGDEVILALTASDLESLKKWLNEEDE